MSRDTTTGDHHTPRDPHRSRSSRESAGGSGSANQTGTSELLHIDDNNVCLDADITSDAGGEPVGTHTGPIVADTCGSASQ
jgi:hypothetical protein